MESGYIDLFRDLMVNPQSTLKSLKQASLQSAFIYFIFVLGVFAAFPALSGGCKIPPEILDNL